VVRQHLSSELGFSRADRDRNVRRIGFVAAEVTKSGGVAICAPIAPYDATRRDVRRMVGVGGGFVLVHVRTPLRVCERRDRKGLYAKARLGLLPSFTGITDPYEEPTDADVVVDGHGSSPQSAARRIVEHLEQQGYLRPGG
jgi:sulfate adenylyltransferase